MLTIDYHEFTYFSENKVYISYDAESDDLQFDYSSMGEHLENYKYDFERIRSIITDKNIEQFFKVRTYKAPEGRFVDTEGATHIEVTYNGNRRTLNFVYRGERIYTKRPVLLIERIDKYAQDLNEVIRKQIDRKYELRNMGISLPENPTEEEKEEYSTGLMWESLSYSETKPTKEERKAAADKFSVSLEACEKWKFVWWKRLKQHHPIKWLD